MIVTIGGNIGCGKTTILSKLKQNTRINVFTEPIEKWGSWLDLFYSDKQRYSFPFQMKILIDFLYLEKTVEDPLLITERSPQDSLNVFAKALVDSKDLSYMEFNLLKEYVDKIGWVPNVYIYVRTSPEICKARMDARNRECECGVTLDYLRVIHDKYESFTSKALEDNKCFLHIVDGTQSADTVYTEVNRIVESLNHKNIFTN